MKLKLFATEVHKEGIIMNFKTALKISSGILLLIFIYSPSLAQIQELCEFKGVKIPWTLKYEDIVVKKGTYDLTFLRHGPTMYYLRVKKKGKTIALFPHGEKVDYKDGGDLFNKMGNPDIPDNAKLEIKRNPALKNAYIIFETGKHSKIYPLHRIRFIVKYED
jgi:hypothetical protein